MSIRFIRTGLLFFGVAALLGSCFEPPNFNDTPSISSPSVTSYPAFDDFSQVKKDSVVISIRFRDGDGDLGISEGERADSTLLKQYVGWGNYELRTYRLVGGSYQELVLPVLNRLFFPRLKRDDKNSPLEGTLDFSQSFPYSRGYRMTPVKFTIRIRDRQLRESNVIETDTISVPLTF